MVAAGVRHTSRSTSAAVPEEVSRKANEAGYQAGPRDRRSSDPTSRRPVGRRNTAVMR